MNGRVSDLWVVAIRCTIIRSADGTAFRKIEAADGSIKCTFEGDVGDDQVAGEEGEEDYPGATMN